MKIEKRIYKNINGSSTDQLDYVIPEGKTFYLRELSGNANYSPSTRVEVIFDPAGDNQLLFSTNGSNTSKSFEAFTGDGAKVLRIKLINDSILSATLGASFWGDEL